MLKNPAGRSIEVQKAGDIYPDADFTGFECRWKGVPAKYDHKLSILILSTMSDDSEHSRVYRCASEKIAEIYGLEHHPIELGSLSLATRVQEMMQEAIVRTNDGNWLQRFLYLCRLFITLAAGRVIFARGIDTEAVEWSRYQKDLITNTDFKKFDGVLKMIVDGTKQQKNELETFLRERQDQGELVYGLHASKDALLTCLIFDYNQDHIHFLDGGDGGYAIAAKQLKTSLKVLKASY